MRNNLTLLDEVILHGEGGADRFAFEEDTGDPAIVFDGTKIVYARTGTQEPPADANKKGRRRRRSASSRSRSRTTRCSAARRSCAG